MKLRKLFALLLVAIMVVPFAAVAEEAITISVLNYSDKTAANAFDAEEKIWGAYQEANPGVIIDKEDEFNDPFHQTTEAYAAAGDLPDVMYAWPAGRSTTLHTEGLLKDLAPLAERDGLADYIVPVALDGAQQGAGYLGIIPFGVTATNAFFVNLEVLEAVGLEPAKTYSELVAQVPVLAEAGYETVLMANQDDWVMQSCLFSLVAGRFMGEGWENRILSGEAKFTDDAFVAALAFIDQCYEDGVINRSTMAVGYGEGPGLFADNRAAYYIDGDWRVGAFITDATTGEALISPERQENILITVFPEIDVEGVVLNSTNTATLACGYGINANLEDGSPELEAAWDLVKYLVGADVSAYRVSTGGVGTPSNTQIDYSALDLEPLQVAIANLGGEYEKSTCVIDSVFDAAVFTPLNVGLAELGLGGITTPEAIAQSVQDAFDAWAAAAE